MPDYRAVIFDCDGVLMDSEILFCAATAEAFTKAGVPMTTQEYIAANMGRSHTDVSADLKKRGINVEVKIDAAELLTRPSFRRGLVATPYTAEVLSQLRLPFAIASGSSMERLHDTLKHVGLFDYFTNHIYSAQLVANPKPAPDVFLYAAQQLGVPAQNCLVVEDGFLGTRGAKAAGMDVVGYSGASHMNDELIAKLYQEGARCVISDMRELIKLLA